MENLDIELAKELSVRPKAYMQRNNISYSDLNSCGGVAEADARTNTCAICVALNRVVYPSWNPIEFFHWKCKCSVDTYKNELRTLFKLEKVTEYLFVNVDKAATMRSFGYYKEDFGEVYRMINQAVLTAYKYGQYKYQALNIYGQHVTIYWQIPGKRDHLGEVFNCHTGCILYPYGKIYVVSPLIGD